MKKFLSAVLAFVFVLGVSLESQAAYKEEYKLDLVPNAQTAWGKGAQFFCDLVKERSNGRINIRPYFNSQLTSGKQTSSMMQLRNGAFDFAWQGVLNWAPQIIEFNFFALPFFMNTYEEIDAVRAGKSGKMLIDVVNSKGVKFLAWGENGYRVLTNNKRDINKPDDLKGLKVRVVGSSLIIDTFKALGADPVNMNWSDVMSAIQQGVIDGQENPFNYLYAFKIQDYHKYMADWHYINDSLVLCVNPAVFGTFSKEDQALIQKCAEDAGKYQIAMARVGLDDGSAIKYLESIGEAPEVRDFIKAVEQAGAKVTKLSPEAVAEFMEKTKAVRESWKDKVNINIYNAAIEDMKTVKK